MNNRESKLEEFVDTTSVKRVLLALSSICDGKAAHISQNWQDMPLAKTWMKVSKQIQKLADRITV